MKYSILIVALELHEHYQQMAWNAETSSVQGFVSNLKGKIAELEAEGLLEDRFSGYDFSIADNLNQPGWDLRGVNSRWTRDSGSGQDGCRRIRA